MNTIKELIEMNEANYAALIERKNSALVEVAECAKRNDLAAVEAYADAAHKADREADRVGGIITGLKLAEIAMRMSEPEEKVEEKSDEPEVEVLLNLTEIAKSVGITEKSLEVFHDYADDAANWSGSPLVGGNVGGSKEECGNLTQLKKAGLIGTSFDEGETWVHFTDAGKDLAEKLGIEREVFDF